MAKPQYAEALEGASSVRKHYLETLNLVERLHRQLLDVIKDELDRRDEREINSVQALLLFNVGDQELTAGELRTRGHYLGSNVSYNLKKLVEAGYIHHERSEADRRCDAADGGAERSPAEGCDHQRQGRQIEQQHGDQLTRDDRGEHQRRRAAGRNGYENNHDHQLSRSFRAVRDSLENPNHRQPDDRKPYEDVAL